MNRLLLMPADVLAPGMARLTDTRRVNHLRQVLRAVVGDTLKIGLWQGGRGTATLLSVSETAVDLAFELDTPSLPRSGTILVVALPRPKMLRRIVHMATMFGVDELVWLNSYRVEKSYWQSPILAPDALHEQVVLGLEQAGDTQSPHITLATRFKPWVEDVLPGLLAGRAGFVAHPGAVISLPALPSPQPRLLAIGPEGGWIPYELAQLTQAGLAPVGLGERILRVDTAVAAALGRWL